MRTAFGHELVGPKRKGNSKDTEDARFPSNKRRGGFQNMAPPSFFFGWFFWCIRREREPGRYPRTARRPRGRPPLSPPGGGRRAVRDRGDARRGPRDGDGCPRESRLFSLTDLRRMPASDAGARRRNPSGGRWRRGSGTAIGSSDRRACIRRPLKSGAKEGAAIPSPASDVAVRGRTDNRIRSPR